MVSTTSCNLVGKEDVVGLMLPVRIMDDVIAPQHVVVIRKATLLRHLMFPLYGQVNSYLPLPLPHALVFYIAILFVNFESFYWRV